NNRNYKLALDLAKFSIQINPYATDQNQKILQVNYALALYLSKRVKEANKYLDSLDWSASIDDFKLAKTVIKEDYEAARLLMIKIGKKGALIERNSYHDWPLFKKFRSTDEFLSSYEKIYGRSFSKAMTEQLRLLKKK